MPLRTIAPHRPTGQTGRRAPLSDSVVDVLSQGMRYSTILTKYQMNTNRRPKMPNDFFSHCARWLETLPSDVLESTNTSVFRARLERIVLLFLLGIRGVHMITIFYGYIFCFSSNIRFVEDVSNGFLMHALRP